MCKFLMTFICQYIFIQLLYKCIWQSQLQAEPVQAMLSWLEGLSDNAFYMHASETTQCCNTPGSLPVQIDDWGPNQLVPAHSMPGIWRESAPVLSSPNMWRTVDGPQYHQAGLSRTFCWLQNVSLNVWKTEHKVHEDGTASNCAW
jgi:hypothetical protein